MQTKRTWTWRRGGVELTRTFRSRLWRVLGMVAALGSLGACSSGDTCSDCVSSGGSSAHGGASSGGSSSGGSTTGGAATGGSGGAPSAESEAYCACMLTKCHDLYHATWGEDHVGSEAACLAEAELVPRAGAPMTTGDSIECRQQACDMGDSDGPICQSAMGQGDCQAE